MTQPSRSSIIVVLMSNAADLARVIQATCSCKTALIAALYQSARVIGTGLYRPWAGRISTKAITRLISLKIQAPSRWMFGWSGVIFSCCRGYLLCTYRVGDAVIHCGAGSEESEKGYANSYLSLPFILAICTVLYILFAFYVLTVPLPNLYPIMHVCIGGTQDAISFHFTYLSLCMACKKKKENSGYSRWLYPGGLCFCLNYSNAHGPVQVFFFPLFRKTVCFQVYFHQFIVSSILPWRSNLLFCLFVNLYRIWRRNLISW